MLTSIRTTSGSSSPRELDRLAPVAARARRPRSARRRRGSPRAPRRKAVVVGDEHADRLAASACAVHPALLRSQSGRGRSRERIQKLLVTGDNRLKQGVDPAKARESWEQALAVAREAGLEERIRPLVEVRLADSIAAARLRIASIRSA